MESDIRYLIDQGKIYFKNQAYKKAEAVFLKILSHKQEFADVYNMLGVIYHQSGQFSQAINHFEKALKINSNYTEAMLNLSVLYNDLGDYKKSKQLLSKSKKALNAKDPIDPFIKGKLANQHAETGDLYRGVGMYRQAIEEFKKALELAPHFYDIRNRLGICLREEGHKKESLKEFEQIVKARPGYADAHIQLGLTLFGMGQYGDARKVWVKLAQSNPKHELVKTYLRLSETSGKQNGAVKKKPAKSK